MEKRYRGSLLMWIGSILIALLILSSLGFGAYQIYAMGWVRGATAAKEGNLTDSPQVLPVIVPRYKGHRMIGSPFLLFILIIIVIGTFFRHSAWRKHTARSGWRHGPAKWVWRCHYPDHPDAEHPYSQEKETEDEEEGGV